MLDDARSLLKQTVERAFGSPLAQRLLRPHQRGARLVLAYHDVSPVRSADGGDRSLHLPLSSFHEQWNCLVRSAIDLAPLADPHRADSRSPRVSVTFDDACEGALQFAVPELAARSIPATIFIAPGLLGNESPWWDRLADPALGAVAVSIRDRALVEFKGRHDQILQAADALGWTVHPPDPAFRIGTEDDLERALRLHPGLTLGAHSWSHANLTSLDAVELQEEMVKPLQWLRERWPDRTIPWLAYPYGLESPAVRRAAAKAGYQGALLVRGGWHRDVPDPFGVPRLNVSAGISLNGFRARLNGLIPG